MPKDAVDYIELLQRLKAADTVAFEVLYTTTRHRLYLYAYSILNDAAAAQDVVQELFLHLWQEQQFAQIHTGLIAYLLRSVHNRCIDYVNKEQNRARIRTQLALLLTEPDTAPDKLAIQELRAEINTAFDHLSPMPAKVFYMHYIEKLSYAEIAHTLGISSNTVGNHMAKALTVLRNYLKKR